MIGAVEGI